MTNPPNSNHDPEMRAAYDLTTKVGVRGKYAARMAQGYQVVVTHPDGTTTTTQHAPTTVITLDPDVQAYFPDAIAVNQALRALISILPMIQHPTE